MALISDGLSPNLRDTSTVAITELIVTLPKARTNKNMKIVFPLNESKVSI
jgi:hypothetical protein